MPKLFPNSSLPDEDDVQAEYCDSDYAHNDLWPEAGMQFGLDSSAEYFDVPRGRVLWSPTKQISVIDHGNATPQPRLEQIAEMFHLDKWTAHTDIHYIIGDVVDPYFYD